VTKRRKPRRSIAIHEAGHAVIAMHVGCRPPTVITMIEDDDAFGRVPWDPPGAWYEPEAARNDARVRRFCEQLAMTGLAGVLAEKRLTGRHNHKGAGDDYRLVAHWTGPVCYSPAEHQAYIEWLTRRTEALIKNDFVWEEIEAVANALLVKESLTARELRSVLRDYAETRA
jgi:hypothetical protein